MSDPVEQESAEGSILCQVHFYDLRNWSDAQWQAARERIETQNKNNRA
jgi:hypothetical protein